MYGHLLLFIPVSKLDIDPASLPSSNGDDHTPTQREAIRAAIANTPLGQFRVANNTSHNEHVLLVGDEFRARMRYELGVRS